MVHSGGNRATRRNTDILNPTSDPFYLPAYLVSDFICRHNVGLILKIGISLMLRNIVSISCPWWPLGWRIADGFYTLE